MTRDAASSPRPIYTPDRFAETEPTSLYAWRERGASYSEDRSPEANAAAYRDLARLVERGDWTAAIPYARAWLNAHPFRVFHRSARTPAPAPIPEPVVVAAIDTAIWRALSSPRFADVEPEKSAAWLVAWLYGGSGREGAIHREARQSYSGDRPEDAPTPDFPGPPAECADPGTLDLEPKPAALFSYWWNRVQDDKALTVPQAARELWPGPEHRLARWEASRRIRRAASGIVVTSDGHGRLERKRTDGGKCSPGGFDPNGEHRGAGGARLRWPDQDGRAQRVSLAWAKRGYVSAWNPAPYLRFALGEPVRRIRPKASARRRKPTRLEREAFRVWQGLTREGLGAWISGDNWDQLLRKSSLAQRRPLTQHSAERRNELPLKIKIGRFASISRRCNW